MAIEFSNVHATGPWTYKRGGANPREVNTSETCSGNTACARVYYGYTSGLFMRIDFFASTAMTYAEMDRSNSTTYTGAVNTTYNNPDGSIFKTAPSQYIDSVTKDSSTEQDLTKFANYVPWFHYTNATLYARLKQLYPSYNTFGIRVYGSNGNGLTSRVTYSGMLHSDYSYSSGVTSDAICSNAPGVSSTIPTSLQITGRVYDGNPTELGGNNWQNGNALAMWLLLSEDPPTYSVRVDMYINGQESPGIGVEWTRFINGIPVDNDPFLNNVKLKMDAFAPYLGRSISDFTTIDPETGRRVLSTYALGYAKGWYWDLWLSNEDFLDTFYNTIAANATRGMSDALLIGNFGINKLPEKLYWFFQLYYEDENGDTFKSTMWSLDEPRVWDDFAQDHILEEYIDGETTGNQVSLSVVLHNGKSDNQDGDDNNDGHGDNGDGDDGNHGDTWPDFTPYKPTGFSGNNVLTKLYGMPAATLALIGNHMWTQSYFDVLKVQNNPIENIVACKWFPFNPTGTAANVVVGNIDFGVQADVISRMLSFHIGSYKYTGRTGFHNFIDQTPFTEVQLHLPYIGTYQIDASILFNNTLDVTYYVDLCTGECMAEVTISGTPYLNATGMIGVDIPITSSDRVQTEMKVMSNTLKTGAGVAGEVLTGDILGAAAGAATGALSVCGADYTSQRTANPSSACGSFQNHAVYLTFAYPDTFSRDGYGLDTQGTGFAHTKGYPCHAWKRLASFGDASGKTSYFVQIDKRTEINIDMTSEESAELENLLTTGVYI